MTFESDKYEEDGYLILDSLFTLMILMAIIMILKPLVVGWLSDVQEAKDLVEQSRFLYESSVHLRTKQLPQFEKREYILEGDKNRLKVIGTEVEVLIYETIFE